MAPNKIEDLKRLIVSHQRRLQVLREQQALQGLSADPKIPLEIQDIEEKIEKLQIELRELDTDEPSLAKQYFSMANQAFIAGDLWEAERYYRMTLTEDPFYPQATQQLDAVRRQLQDRITEANSITFLAELFRFIIKEASWPWLVLICAFATPFAGGIVWNLLSTLLGRPEHMGGSGNEPHGFYAFIWGFITIFPVIFFAFLACSKLLNWNSFPKWLTAFIFYAFFGGLGAVLFYDFGFRNYVENLKLGYESQEIIIVALWSGIISVSTYLSLLVLYPILKELINFQYLFAQIPTAVILSVLGIIFFLLVAEPTPTFDQVRGIVAGFSLRLSLFLGLILSISIGPFIKNFSEIDV